MLTLTFLLDEMSSREKSRSKMMTSSTLRFNRASESVDEVARFLPLLARIRSGSSGRKIDEAAERFRYY